MSQRSRQRLAIDAEKLYAAQRLWLRHNDILASGHTHGVLTEAVYSYMHDAGESHHEDYMRAFFRLKARDLGALLPRVGDVVIRSSSEVTQSLAENLPQGNDIVLVGGSLFGAVLSPTSRN
jgi:nuclear pore complex protein Nup133